MARQKVWHAEYGIAETVKPIKVMSPHLGNKSELTAQKIFNAYFNSNVEMYKIYFLLTW